MLKTKHKFLFILMSAFLLFIAFFSITLGIANISFFQSIKIVLSKVPLISKFINLQGIDEISKTIIIDIRMPRILIAAMVGMGLSVVGTTFQGIFKNPMADPYILGVSSGAALGASIAIAFGFGASLFGMSFVTFSSFLGAMITVVLVYNIARIGNKVSTNTLLLSGIAVSSLMSSIISLIMIFNRQQMEKIVFWTMGSISTSSWQQVVIMTPIVILGCLFIFFFSRELDVILIGDETAKSVGIETEKVKKILLILSSIVVSVIVSISGIIGFVGLIVPHTLRMLVGSKHRILIPFSAIGGAIFMIIVDTIARIVIPPIEIPVGAVTAICGAPYFIYLLNKVKRRAN